MIRVSVVPAPGNALHIRGLERFARNRREGLMRVLGAEQVRNQHRRLKTREGIDGAIYSESGRATRDTNLKRKKSGTTLVDKGHMSGAMRVLKATADEAIIGFGSALEGKKALWHQYGTSRGLPSRPFFGVAPSDSRVLQEKADAWLKAHARREMK